MYSREELERRRERLSPAGLALLRQRLRGGAPQDTSSPMTIPVRPLDEPAVVSFAQERLWFLQQLEPGSCAYNEPLAVRICGPLDTEILRCALTQIVTRHEVLRSIFPLVDGVVRPVIQAEAVILGEQDIRGLGHEEREAYVISWAADETRKPFRLSEDLPWRAGLLRLQEEEHVLLVVMHHIITDAWSLEIFVRELTGSYGAMCAAHPSAFPPLPLQYADYAYWQRSHASKTRLEGQVSYWRQQLLGSSPALALPFDHAQKIEGRAPRGRQYHWRMSARLCHHIHELSQHEGVTPFIVLLTAFYALLYRYTGQEDMLIGTSTAGRAHVELEPLLGCFATTLPLRASISGRSSFRQVLHQVRTMVLDAYDHQDVPFEQLVELLRRERDSASSLQAMFVLQNTPVSAEPVPNLRIHALDIDVEGCKFDLSLVMREVQQEWGGYIEYNAERFDASTIERLIDHYLCLLESVTERPAGHIVDLSLLPASEQQRILVEWNPKSEVCSEHDALHQFFEQQARRTPQAPAIIYEDEVLSYEEVNRRANCLARYLLRRGAGLEVPIGICMERSPEMMIGVLAILKAGAAYVPLDTARANERLLHIVQQSGLALIVTQESMVEHLPDTIELVCLDRDQAGIAQESALDLACSSPPESLAYIIFTSGSTGKPKGVAVSHKSACSSLQARLRYYAGDGRTRFLLLSALSFDSSVAGLFWTLACGGALVLPRERELYSVGYLLQLIEQQQVSHCLTIPSLYQLIIASARPRQVVSLRTVIVAGEVCPQSLLHEHYQKTPVAALFNEYGPTEASVWSSVYRCSAQDIPAAVPLGFPIESARVYVLDESMRPVPIGVTGEIYIGGSGVARGYVGSARLTAERFLPHPFGTRAGERLYRTGDRARFAPDGALQFVGRADRQVKIRGFRIELGEVEQAIVQHPMIERCTVIAREDRPGDTYLLCYLVATDDEVSDEVMRRFLADYLPTYMHPSAYIVLSQLPLLPNGKVDYAHLPEPHLSTHDTHFVAAHDPVEEILVDTWLSLLNVERVGTHDDFFLLGGHSLLAAKLIARVREVLGVELSFQDIIEDATIEQLAVRVRQLWRSEQPLLPPPLLPMARDQEIPLGFAQQRQWLRNHLDPSSSLYTIFGGVQLKGNVDGVLVERALGAMIERHEILRTTFHLLDGQPIQRIAEACAPALNMIDVREWVGEERAALVQRILDREHLRAIDLSHGPMLYVTLLRLETDEFMLLFTSHHIVFDGWSVNVFLREFTGFYLAFARDAPSPFPALKLHYADYVLWQHTWLQGPVRATLLAYWKQQLAALPILTLPTDRPRPRQPTFRSALLPLQLAPNLVLALKELCRREGVTLFMALLAAFQCMLARHSGQQDIAVGSPLASRAWTEVEGLIGCFTNILVLRTDLAGNPTLRELLWRVRSVTLQAHTHQALPFEMVLNEVPFERHQGRNPLFQVLFALQNIPPENISLPDIEVRPLEIDDETTLFDVDMSLSEYDDNIYGGLKYSTDLFDEPIMARMRDDFLAVLEALVSDASCRLADISYLAKEQQWRLLQEWNSTQADFAHERCIHELFEAQVERAPDAVALVFGKDQLTYRQVNQQANRLAHHLRAVNVGSGSLVAICVDRCMEMVPALLGILKAGAAYIPCEPSFPKARLQWVLSSLSVPVLITQSHHVQTIKSLEDIPALKHVICLDHASAGEEPMDEWWLWSTEQMDALPVENLPRLATARDVAYIIFTSGSTGQPKGVVVRHQPVINLIEWVNSTFEVRASDRLLFITSLCFDLSVYDMFGLLAAGGSLEIVARDDIRDPERLLALLSQASITFWDSAPAALQQLVPFLADRTSAVEAECVRSRDSLSGLRLIFLSGDWIPVTLPGSMQEAFPGVEVVGLGGATEATVWSNYFPIGEVSAHWMSIPYGRPIQNARYYILDADMQPCQVGVTGDLYIGGLCLADGYINAPALTAQRFLPDPFTQEMGARLYKTGDLARFWSDGTIEFQGRSDTQVKIRGFRVELGEVEAALLRHPAVHAAVVEAPYDATGARYVVAYMVMAQGREHTIHNIHSIRQYLREQLPEYMLPSQFVPVASLPLTANGKVDRAALPRPDDVRLHELVDSYVMPRTPVEEALADIWSDTLHLPRVGIEDNFFEIGGHSLLSIGLLSRIRARWGIEMPLRDLFETQTIATLALRIERALAIDQNTEVVDEAVDLRQEATLDEEIRAPEAYGWTSGEAGHIFLSGASGFLGSTLLAELLQETTAVVHCLVRCDSPDEGHRRVRAGLERIGCWHDAYALRIVPVAGDLALPLLGLSDERFEQIARSVDVVYHSGALVNSVYRYQELKAVNVMGTQEMLRLASVGKVKPFHYVSTLSVLAPAEGTTVAHIDEDEPLDLHIAAMQDGYMQSKWVAEKLVMIARARGIPASIYRPGRISGHSRTGAWPTDDILCRRLKGCIQLGAIPHVVTRDLLEMTPVDYVGRAIVALSRQPRALNKTFHLCNSSVALVSELVTWINDFGYPLRHVPYAQWISDLKENAAGSGDNVLVPFLSLLPDAVEEDEPQVQSMRLLFDDRHARAALATTSISCPPIDAALMATYLAAFVRGGFLGSVSDSSLSQW